MLAAMGVSEAMLRYMGGEPPWPAFALKRYSPRPQASVVWTEEWQNTAVSEACEFFGLIVVEEGIERLVSGRKARLRPAVERAKELAALRRIRALVVGDWRRFSRDDPKRVLMLVASLQEQGVVIFSNAQKDLVPWEDFYWVKVAFYAEIANKEATSSAAASARSIQEARNAGVAWGRTPIGWKRLDKVGNYIDAAERAAARLKSRFVPDESESAHSMEVLRDAYRRRDQGWSFHALARQLGIPASSLRVALLGGVLPDGTRSNARNRDAVGSDLYDRVVSRGTGGVAAQTTRRPWYLRGLVRCPFCDSRMSGHEARDRGTGHSIRYYVCHSYGRPQRNQRPDTDRPTPHPWTHVREDTLVEHMRWQLASLAFSEEQMQIIARSAREPSRQLEIDRRQVARRDLARRIRAINVQHEAGGLSDGEYTKRLRELQAQRVAIPDDPPSTALSTLALHATVARQVVDAIPLRLDDPQEVTLAGPLLRRMVSRVDLDATTREPRFTYTKPVAETLELARRAGVVPSSLTPSTLQIWMTPTEVGHALARSRSTVGRRLRDGSIPYQATGGPRLYRYRIPRAWVDQKLATGILRAAAAEEDGVSALTIVDFAKRTGLA